MPSTELSMPIILDEAGLVPTTVIRPRSHLMQLEMH